MFAVLPSPSSRERGDSRAWSGGGEGQVRTSQRDEVLLDPAGRSTLWVQLSWREGGKLSQRRLRNQRTVGACAPTEDTECPLRVHGSRVVVRSPQPRDAPLDP